MLLKTCGYDPNKGAGTTRESDACLGAVAKWLNAAPLQGDGLLMPYEGSNPSGAS